MLPLSIFARPAGAVRHPLLYSPVVVGCARIALQQQRPGSLDVGVETGAQFLPCETGPGPARRKAAHQRLGLAGGSPCERLRKSRGGGVATRTRGMRDGSVPFYLTFPLHQQHPFSYPLPHGTHCRSLRSHDTTARSPFLHLLAISPQAPRFTTRLIEVSGSRWSHIAHQQPAVDLARGCCLFILLLIPPLPLSSRSSPHVNTPDIATMRSSSSTTTSRRSSNGRALLGLLIIALLATLSNAAPTQPGGNVIIAGVGQLEPAFASEASSLPATQQPLERSHHESRSAQFVKRGMTENAVLGARTFSSGGTATSRSRVGRPRLMPFPALDEPIRRVGGLMEAVRTRGH